MQTQQYTTIHYYKFQKKRAQTHHSLIRKII